MYGDNGEARKFLSTPPQLIDANIAINLFGTKKNYIKNNKHGRRFCPIVGIGSPPPPLPKRVRLSLGLKGRGSNIILRARGCLDPIRTTGYRSGTLFITL